MRIAFGALSLLIVVAVVAMLARKQLGAVAPTAASVSAGQAAGGVVAPGTPQQQVRQFQNAVQGAVQQARPMPEDK
ncbi:MAG: hypothetical protein NDJ19_08635 [Ramlibacter sp.]|nr:hypothetical protein [Ramlibacter sp.]